MAALIFTERAGRLRFMDKNGNISDAGEGHAQLCSCARMAACWMWRCHPDYAKNGWIYLSYTTRAAGLSGAAGRARMRPTWRRRP